MYVCVYMYIHTHITETLYCPGLGACSERDARHMPSIINTQQLLLLLLLFLLFYIIIIIIITIIIVLFISSSLLLLLLLPTLYCSERDARDMPSHVDADDISVWHNAISYYMFHYNIIYYT